MQEHAIRLFSIVALVILIIVAIFVSLGRIPKADEAAPSVPHANYGIQDEAWRDGSWSLTVTDTNGRGLEGVAFTLSDMNNKPLGKATSDETGHITMTGLDTVVPSGSDVSLVGIDTRTGESSKRFSLYFGQLLPSTLIFSTAN